METDSAEETQTEESAVEQDETEQGLTGQGISEQATVSETAEETSAAAEPDEPKTLFIHVCGAVVSPGVYELAEGSRVYEAVDAAGGFAEDACENFVNLAQTVADGQRLYIPTMEEVETDDEDLSVEIGLSDGLSDTTQSASAGSETGAATGLVNINTASEAELCTLTGIGATRAQAIIAYREANGSFSSIEDIMNVSGIKEATYEKIKDEITV